MKDLPSARRKNERRTTTMARPANTPTMIATVFPTWSWLEEESIPAQKEKEWELVLWIKIDKILTNAPTTTICLSIL